MCSKKQGNSLNPSLTFVLAFLCCLCYVKGSNSLSREAWPTKGIGVEGCQMAWGWMIEGLRQIVLAIGAYSMLKNSITNLIDFVVKPPDPVRTTTPARCMKFMSVSSNSISPPVWHGTATPCWRLALEYSVKVKEWRKSKCKLTIPRNTSTEHWKIQHHTHFPMLSSNNLPTVLRQRQQSSKSRNKPSQIVANDNKPGPLLQVPTGHMQERMSSQNHPCSASSLVMVCS